MKRIKEYFRTLHIPLWYGIIIIVLMVCLLSSCRTQYVSVPEYHSVYVDRHDTLLTHDSIYQHEFIDRYIQGDTVYLTKTNIKYRDRFLYRTVTKNSIRTDSIRVPYPVERKLNSWEHFRMALGSVTVVIIATITLMLIVIWLIRRYR